MLRTPTIAAVLSALALTVCAAPASADSSGPAAPTNLQLTRDGNDNNFTVDWNAPGGPVDHYVVTIFADGGVRTINVPASQTSVDVTGNTKKTIYNVRVAAEDAAGNGSASGQVALEPVLPGAPVNVIGHPASFGSGLTVEWSRPARKGLHAIGNYHVVLTNSDTGKSWSADPRNPNWTFPYADAAASYTATVTAITSDGAGLAESANVGGHVPTAPQGLTAVREPWAPGQVAVSWSAPSWAGDSDIAGYQIGTGDQSITHWTDVGNTTSTVLPLAGADSGVYAVRAVNGQGVGVASELVTVETRLDSLVPSSAYPVTVSRIGRQITADFASSLNPPGNSLVVRLLPYPGWSYRSEQVIPQSATAYTVNDVPNGRYRLTVSGIIGRGTSETLVFSQDVVVDDSNAATTGAEASFADGKGQWRGVWPSGHMPRVVTSNDMVFDGSTSLAITSTANLLGNTMAIGTGGLRVVPTAAGQTLMVSAKGLAPTSASHWVIGISWWDAQGHQLSIHRVAAKQGNPGVWQSESGAFTAPAGAVAASAFIEMGDVERGDTFYIDGLSMRSAVTALHPETADDWVVVRGSAAVQGSVVNMNVSGETSVLDPKTSSPDITVLSQGQLINATGYGIWLRASWNSASQMTGYSVQLDPGWGGEFILRHWYKGSECWKPLAEYRFPGGFDAYAPHNFAVTISGNSLSSTVDNAPALMVPSLSAALAQEPCNYPAPTGTAVGFRTWGSLATLTGTVLAPAN